MDLARFYAAEFDRHEAALRATRQALRAPFCRLVEACVGSLKAGGRLFFFGNGGSAGDAQHLASELSVRYARDRPAIAALALAADAPALTAAGNDLGFERVFARQLEALGRPGDVALGLTTSGRSANVLAALRFARDHGMVAAALAGRDGGDLAGLAQPLLIVPDRATARIQEMHLLLGQMLCAAIEIELGLVAEAAP